MLKFIKNMDSLYSRSQESSCDEASKFPANGHLSGTPYLLQIPNDDQCCPGIGLCITNQLPLHLAWPELSAKLGSLYYQDHL